MTNWLTGWLKRKSHVINAAAGAGTLYQKQIKVYRTTSPALVRTAKADMTYKRMFSQQGVINGKIYVVGGRSFGSSRFNYNEEYNPATDTWATKTAYPILEDAASCGVLVDADSVTRFHVVCGYPDNPAVHKHYGYDPIDNDWTEYAAGPLMMWDGGGVVINNKLYIFGGSTDGNCKTTIYEYDPATNAWVQKTSMTYARAMFAFSVHNSKIYVFTGGWGVPTSTVEVFDPVANSWTTLNPAPEQLGHASKESINGKIYLHTWGDSTRMYEYDPATDTYDLMTISSYTPITVLSLECVVIGTKFYAIGGQTASDVAKTCYELEVTATSTDGAEKVHLGGNCRTDFGDIRFTDNDGDTLLDCWMESKVNSSYATFWVEVADSLETDPVTIYIYYGNVNATYPYLATVLAHGQATFLLFDDFNDASLDTAIWTKSEGAGGSVTESGGILTVYQAASSGVVTKASSIATFETNTAMRALCKSAEGKSVSDVIGYINVYTWATRDTIAKVTTRTWDVGSQRTSTYKTQYQDNVASLDLTNYHIWDMIRNASTNCLFLKDNVAVATHATQVPTTTFGLEFVAQTWDALGNGYVYVDWVAVRKYVSPEPAHSTWGTEETNLVTKIYSADVVLKALDTIIYAGAGYGIDTLFKKLDTPNSYSLDAVLKALDTLNSYPLDVVQKLLDEWKSYLLDVVQKRLIDLKSYLFDVSFRGSGVGTYLIDIMLELPPSVGGMLWKYSERLFRIRQPIFVRKINGPIAVVNIPVSYQKLEKILGIENSLTRERVYRTLLEEIKQDIKLEKYVTGYLLSVGDNLYRFTVEETFLNTKQPVKTRTTQDKILKVQNTITSKKMKRKRNKLAKLDDV